MSAVRVSAPGKVLLAGGYLVLESPNVGVVLAADKRFYSTVRSLPPETEGSSVVAGTVIVKSPQFHSQWEYHYNADGLCASPNNHSENGFVEKTLRVALMYVQPPPEKVRLEIVIQADNDFYSIIPHLGEDKSPAAVQKLPKFLNCPQDSQGRAIVHKTGLGSSAALTASLVGALIHFYASHLQGYSKETSLSHHIHNLAQICHCHAQGKVGSGFDVSAAMNGSHLYRRFPKCLLSDLLQQLEHNVGGGRQELVTLVETEWKDDMVTPLPITSHDDANADKRQSQLQLLLADVCGGSESPSMARTILTWKQQTKGANPTQPIPHWDDLKLLNSKVAELLETISTMDEQELEYDRLADIPAVEWPETSPLKELHKVFQTIRSHLKVMGEKAGVPVEPDEPTKLCDATVSIPGVVAAVVPGAGGYDAVACLYIDRPAVLDRIGVLWTSFKDPVICPLGVRISSSGLHREDVDSVSC